MVEIVVDRNELELAASTSWATTVLTVAPNGVRQS